MSKTDEEKPVKPSGRKKKETTAKKRPYKSSASRRLEILKVADSLFMEKGFLATGVKDIVKAVGISYGNFYYHFPTKQDILLAFVTARAERLQKSIEEWNKDDSMGPHDQIMELLDYAEKSRKFRLSLDFLQGGDGREDPELYNTFMNIFLPRLASSFSIILENGNRLGEFKVHDPTGTAILLVIMSLEMMHRVSNVDKIREWKELRITYRVTVARMVGVEDERYLLD